MDANQKIERLFRRRVPPRQVVSHGLAREVSALSRELRRRIGMLRAKNVDSMEFAVDFMMQERVDSYFRIEPGLEEVERWIWIGRAIF